MTASYAGSDESEVVTSGVSIFLANVTGGLPGSGADGTVPFKVLGMTTDRAFTSWHILFSKFLAICALFADSIIWLEACSYNCAEGCIRERSTCARAAHQPGVVHYLR